MPKDLLDLHGYKSDDVEEAVDKFLMRAVQMDLPRVRIMTGKGTGAVQKVVAQYLKLGNYPWKHEHMPNGKKNEGVMVVFLE